MAALVEFLRANADGLAVLETEYHIKVFPMPPFGDEETDDVAPGSLYGFKYSQVRNRSFLECLCVWVCAGWLCACLQPLSIPRVPWTTFRFSERSLRPWSRPWPRTAVALCWMRLAIGRW